MVLITIKGLVWWTSWISVKGFSAAVFGRSRQCQCFITGTVKAFRFQLSWNEAEAGCKCR